MMFGEFFCLYFVGSLLYFPKNSGFFMLTRLAFEPFRFVPFHVVLNISPPPPPNDTREEGFSIFSRQVSFLLLDHFLPRISHGLSFFLVFAS